MPERHAAEETPGPLEHATPDAELAEAQLAVGRPEYAVEGDPELAAEAELADELAGGFWWLRRWRQRGSWQRADPDWRGCSGTAGVDAWPRS